MGVLKTIFNNTGKPQGLLGKIMVSSMNSGHAGVADWGMSFLDVSAPASIADLGCGGGRNAAKLMVKYPTAKLTALDHSEISVEKTRQVNQTAVKCGRCTVLQGDVSCMPFTDEAFDLITAFETVYFWPGPEKSFREAYRVLKRGGTFLIINESDGENKADEKWTSMIDGMTIYDAQQLTDVLKRAGFAEANIHRNEKKHWLCLNAQKC